MLYRDEVQAILDRIEFQFPTGMSWTFKAFQTTQPVRVFVRGYAVGLDARTGAPWDIVTRDYLIDPFSDEASVVRTVWAAVRASVEHEAMEFFRFDGVAVMGPHLYGNGDSKP